MLIRTLYSTRYIKIKTNGNAWNVVLLHTLTIWSQSQQFDLWEVNVNEAESSDTRFMFPRNLFHTFL